MRSSARALLLVSLSLACTNPAPADDAATIDDGGPSDANIDAPTCAFPDPFAIGSPDGHTTPLGAAAGQARAGRIHAGDLPADPSRLATWRDGDYVLANDHLAFVISQPGNQEVYDPYGGRVRSIARLDHGTIIQPADFGLVMLGASRFVVATDSVSVLSDGSDGHEAIVRARGPMVGIEAIGPLLATLVRDDLTDWPAALDYVLAPDSNSVEVRLSVRRPSAAHALNVHFATVAFFQSFRMPSWSELGGFVPPTGAPRFVAFEDATETSYAWVAMPMTDGSPGTVRPFYSTGGFDFYQSPGAVVDGCSEHTFTLGRFTIGETDGLNGVQRVVWRDLAEATTHVTGTLTSTDPAAIAGAHVHVTDAAGTTHLTRATVDATGAFDLVVPTSAASVWVWREGASLEGPFAIPASGPMTIPLAELATVSVDVSEQAGGTSIPARVQIFPVGTSPALAPDAFGERVLGRGRSRMEFAPVGGHVDLRVAPGMYRLVVSHGWEMELHDQTFTLAAGETRNVAASLVRALETPGVMCADYHIHTTRSVDSEDSGELKVSALAADGLEIAIRSDHEWVNDFSPVVHDLGLDDFVLGLAGEELTTFTYGHFGVFPLVTDPARPSGGAVTWFNRFAPDVFDEVRARTESPLLIINHPRANGIRQGYFRETGYDPSTGLPAHPENWDTEFDVVEVINSSSFDHNRGPGGTVEDWYSLLRAGRHVMMVGSSDSHHTHGDPVGYPRTCLWIGTDDIHTVTGDMVRDVTRAGASYVMGGIYLDVLGPSSTRPGGRAIGVGVRAQIHVTVSAPSFVDVDSLEVIVDGTTTETLPITVPTDPTNPVRFDDVVEVDVAASGSFVVLHASGGDTPNIAYGDQPFAVSNPIFLTR